MPRSEGIQSLNNAAGDRASPLPRWHFALQLALVVGLLGLFGWTMSASETVDAGFWPKFYLLARMAFVVLLCTWFLGRSGERWTDVGLRRPPRWWTVPLLVLGGLVAVVLLSSALADFLPAVGLDLPRLEENRKAQGDFAEFLFYATLVAFGSAGFGEELIARGFMIDRFAKLIGSSGTLATLAAIIFQALVFGLFHFYQGWGGVVVTGSVGLLIGLIWLIGGRNLWACILLHGIVDLIAAIEAYAGPGG